MLTRRMFAGLLAGGTAAFAKTQDLVQHKVLRRPYKSTTTVKAHPHWLYDVVYLDVTECRAPLRVTALQEGNPEPLYQVTLVPRPQERVMLLGMHQCRAEAPVTITVESRKPFRISEMDARFMRPSFRRINGRIVFNDPTYSSLEERGFEAGGIHHRKMFGPGKDVGYR